MGKRKNKSEATTSYKGTASVVMRKTYMIAALKASFGNVSKAVALIREASKKEGKIIIDRSLHYDWLKSDDKYKADVDEVIKLAFDDEHDALKAVVMDAAIDFGDVNAAKFILETKHGYSRRAELGVTTHLSHLSDEELQAEWERKRKEAGE